MVELFVNSTSRFMQLNIKNEEARRMAAQLADVTGESMTRAVTEVIRERLEREKGKRGRSGVAEKLMRIGRRCASRPVADPRSPDEILYDKDGLPH